MIAEPRAFLTSLFEAAVKAADPVAAIRAHLPEKAQGTHDRRRCRKSGKPDGGGV